MSDWNLGTSWKQSPGSLSRAMGCWGRAGSWEASTGEDKRREEGQGLAAFLTPPRIPGSC